MADGVEAVDALLERIREKSCPAAVMDLAHINAHRAETGDSGDFHHWDAAFWGERLREARFDYT